MNEIWKPINLEPFNKSHLISNFGNIKTIQGKILSQNIDKDGYYQVCLCYEGLQQTKKVHRLVALTFLYNDYQSGLVVNHKDGIKTNNFVGNLEWVTIQYNTQHGYDMGLSKKGYEHVNAKHYALYDNENNLISQYENMFCIENATNVSRGVIHKILCNNLVEIDYIDYKLPVNIQLNKSEGYINKPIAIYDDTFNVIGLYSNLSIFELNTTITRRIGPKLSNEFYKYKKRGKEFKNIYYIRLIEYIDFFILKCDIIDSELIIG